MPLTIIEPTADVQNVIRGHLEGRATGGQFRTDQLRAAAPANLSLAAPHPIYNLGLDDVGTPNALDKAVLTGWRYVIVDGERGIATAEALPGSEKSKPVFAQTNEGPLARSFAKAIEVAEALPELAEKTYELAVLRIPALYVVAVWLKGSLPGSADDLFLPLDPAPAALNAETKLDAEAFLAALTTLKKERGVSKDASN